MIFLSPIPSLARQNLLQRRNKFIAFLSLILGILYKNKNGHIQKVINVLFPANSSIRCLLKKINIQN